ncbi:hypothetical protein BsWGS_07354 [Bradybaena similaris]
MGAAVTRCCTRVGCVDATPILADTDSVLQECSDALHLTDEERTKQRMYELEISFNGESDLEGKLSKCHKNPGHLDFQPAHNFDLRHLPKKFRCFETLQFIRHLSRLTVKILVKFISPDRPKKFPCSKYAGKRMLMVGSGWVTDVLDNEDIKRLRCPFEDCSETPKDHPVFGYITVLTAAHVVCDDAEASKTIVEFFDDVAGCKTNARTARAVKVGAVSVDGDFCELLCVVHDKSVLETIRKHFSEGKDCVSMKAGRGFRFQKDVAPVMSSIYMNDTKLKRGILDDTVCHVAGLSGDKMIWPCPFKNCSEMSGKHEVYGYVCVLIEADAHGNNDFKAEQLIVEVISDKPGLSRDKWTLKGAYFRPTSMQGCSRELLCVVHQREVFESLKHLLLGNKQIYLYHRFTSYYDIVCDIFKDRLQIEGLSSFVDCAINLSVKIKYDNPECVDTMMALLTYTLPRIEKAVYKHNCSNICFDDQRSRLQPIPVNQRITAETARLHVSGIRRYLEMETTETLQHLKHTIRPKLEKLLRHGAIDKYSLNHFFGREVMDAEWLDPEGGGTNSVILMGVNNNELSLGVEFYDHINLYDRSESMRVLSHITDDNAEDTGENKKKVSGDDNDYDNNDVDGKDENDMLLIHISHPHGKSKHITLGQQTECPTRDGFYRPLYTVPTCPGSSGGPVWMIPASGDLGQVYGVPHSRYYGNQLNEGSSWMLYLL